MGRWAAVLLGFDDTIVDNSVVPAAVEKACKAIAGGVDGLDAGSLLRANNESWSAYSPIVERRCCCRRELRTPRQ